MKPTAKARGDLRHFADWSVRRRWACGGTAGAFCRLAVGGTVRMCGATGADVRGNTCLRSARRDLHGLQRGARPVKWSWAITAAGYSFVEALPMSSTRLAEERPSPYYHRVLGIIKLKMRTCQCRNGKEAMIARVDFRGEGNKGFSNRWKEMPWVRKNQRHAPFVDCTKRCVTRKFNIEHRNNEEVIATQGRAAHRLIRTGVR